MRSEFADATIVHVDIYSIKYDLISNGVKYGEMIIRKWLWATLVSKNVKVSGCDEGIIVSNWCVLMQDLVNP